MAGYSHTEKDKYLHNVWSNAFDTLLDQELSEEEATFWANSAHDAAESKWEKTYE